MIKLPLPLTLCRITTAVGVFALSLSGTQVFAQTSAATYPDPAVEARTARELVALEAQIRTPYRGSVTDDSIILIAHSLARLGRLEAALQVVGHIQILDADVSNGAPQIRAEALRLVARRRCVLGNLDGAKQLISLIKTPLIRADALLALARAYLRRGELESARDTLWRVSPLVQGRIDATAYTAYLLTRSGDRDGAKRLFDRAQARLAPAKKQESYDHADFDVNPEHLEQRLKAYEARYNREYVTRYMIKSGFADEAVHMDGGEHRFLHSALVNDLVEANRFDIALRLARGDDADGKISNLVWLAIMLDQRKRDRDIALKLLAEAEATYRALPASSSDASGDKRSADNREGDNRKGDNQGAVRPHAPDDADKRATLLVFVAYGYRELGQEEKGQQILEEAVAGLSPGRAASLRAEAAIMPLLLARESRTPVGVARLEQIDADITPQLPLLFDPKDGYNLLRWLVEAQIKAGQMDAARVHLPRLEQFAMALIPVASDIYGFSAALEVARHWRQIGDEAQAQRLIQAIYDAPKPQKVTKGSRAHALIYTLVYNGFVKEGLARLAELGPLPDDMHPAPSIAFWQAKFQPHVFPERILNIKEPRERLTELVDFTRGLTEPIFESGEERELVLSVAGYSFSG